MSNHSFLNLNKAFDSRIRLAIMAALVVNQSVSYKELKTQLVITDGNLASHIKALEDLAYVEVLKSFIGKKPSTNYQITASGKKAFKQHIQALESMIKGL